MKARRSSSAATASLLATPMLLVLVMIEATDLMFALDSVPAIFAVTDDPFIVYTSNVFAILGLRSLYFALAGIIHRFSYLKYGLSLVLVFIGTKMILIDIWKVPTASGAWRHRDPDRRLHRPVADQDPERTRPG